jgi:mono/diheme cytochrome c family protein
MRLFFIGFVVSGCLCAQSSVWDGVYSSAQATAGEKGYAQNCASCHGEKLDGKGPMPPLLGKDFLSNWNGMTLGDLFDKIQTSMPADKPGQLKEAQNAEILAYILKVNGFPAGAKSMAPSGNALKGIRIEEKK